MTRAGPPSIPASRFSIQTTNTQRQGQRIVVYGGGGKGKTSLCAALPDPVFIFLGSERAPMDVPHVPDIHTFEDLLEALRAKELWLRKKSVIVDSATAAEAMAVAYTLRNVKTEKGMTATSIEGYGYGKGYRHVNESFRLMLAALDALAQAGLNVAVTAHETVDATPNPAGEDYKSAQPNLMQSGQARLRDLIRDWCDHLLYIGYDVAVDGGKGKSSGSRCIYTQERASWWAKCRANPANPAPYCVPYPLGSDDIWKLIGIK